MSLDVDAVASERVAAVSAPADYLTRDASDFEIEQLQRTSIPAANRLGPVTLPNGLIPAEHLAVNLAITAYFGSGAQHRSRRSFRSGRQALRPCCSRSSFPAANAVTVERIGAVRNGDKAWSTRHGSTCAASQDSPG
ncbi:MAG: hypothetical protein R2844_23105 [Caldilineales bacterium]